MEECEGLERLPVLRECAVEDGLLPSGVQFANSGARLQSTVLHDGRTKTVWEKGSLPHRLSRGVGADPQVRQGGTAVLPDVQLVRSGVGFA